MRKFVSILLALVVSACCVCTGCSFGGSNDDSVENASSATESTVVTAADMGTDDEMFTERDRTTSYDESEAIAIQLNGTTATASADSVKISGSTVTITEEATYVISGSLSNGMIIVDTDENAKPHLVFNGVDITSETSAALYVLEADKVVVTLAEGTENALTNGGSFVAIDENNIDGALHSKQDLTLNGSGTLTVTSPAGHGIVCKDDLVITGGTYTVNAASHGLDANDSVRIDDAALTISAGKDAVHAENSDDASLGFIYIAGGTITVEAEGDGISAGSYLKMLDGTVNVIAGGGSVNGTSASSGNYGHYMGGRHEMGRSAETTSTDESSTSMKGVKAEGNILISGGSVIIDSADDSIHSNTSITINGGTFTLASGDDAVHAEDTLTITDGKIDISESYEGLEALHIAVQGGDINLTASDDGLNAAGGTDSSGTTGGRDGMFGGGMSSGNGSIVISGGTLHINASGDGIDANGTLEICGGYTEVVGPTQGDTATLDYDKSAAITGGTFVGTGSVMMAQTFSSSEHGVIAVNAGSQSAGTEIILKNSSGETVLTAKPELSFAVVILSSPDLVKGETYTLTVGTQTAEFEAS